MSGNICAATNSPSPCSKATTISSTNPAPHGTSSPTIPNASPQSHPELGRRSILEAVGIRALLEEPHRVADEYRGRMARAREGAAMPDEILRLDRQIATLRRGIGRLIDSCTESVIDKAEFEPRDRKSVV